MGELRDLIGIYGAIDRAVAGEPGRRDPVSRLLPVYRRPAVHWFDDFEAWTNEKRGSDEGLAFPPLEDALQELSDIGADGRMRARRLFAIAVALQARPELREPGGELWALAWRALRVEGLAGDDDERARRLLEVLGDDRLLPPIDDEAPGALDTWWESVGAAVSSENLIENAEDMGPRPCSGRLVMVDLPGGRAPVATLMTVWETDRIPFDRATRFLKPSNWPRCSAFWCEMTRGAQAGGVHQYHEVVSTDCAHKATAWTIAADLDFSFTQSPGVAITEYRMSEGHPQPDVLVDEGSLVVEQIGPDDASRLRITTTKRIRFTRSFSGEALAMIMCALGYASVVEDLVFSCAALPEKGSGTRFPGRSPAATRPGSGSVIKDIADEAATAVKECIDDWADAAEASSKAIAEGRYTADALVQDMTSAWVRLLREGATAADVGVRSARTAARARARERSES